MILPSSLKGLKSPVGFARARRQSHAWDRGSSQLPLLLHQGCVFVFLCSLRAVLGPHPKVPLPAMGPRRTDRLCSRTPSSDTAGGQWCPWLSRPVFNGLRMPKGPFELMPKDSGTGGNAATCEERGHSTGRTFVASTDGHMLTAVPSTACHVGMILPMARLFFS